MAKTILTDVRTYFGGADLTSNSSTAELSSECEDKETTNFGSGGWKERIAGLFSTSATLGGQWEAGDGKPDDTTWAALGTATNPLSLVVTSGAIGSLAYLTRAFAPSHEPASGSIGDVAGWSLSPMGTWPAVRGAVAHPAGTARTSSGSATGVELGTVSTLNYLYANLHVFSVSGTDTPTLTVEIESDDNAGFTSATSRLTFTAATAAGGESARVAGPGGSDNYWRATWTITGTDPSFLFAVTFGIH